MAQHIPQHFTEPPWGAPLDTASILGAIPETASIAGMFLSSVADDAKRAGLVLPSLRDRYAQFKFYPLREHAQVVLEACASFFPRLTLRQALRKIGRATPRALITSTLGRVMFGTAEGVNAMVESLTKTFPINMRPCRAEVLENSAGRAIIRLEEVHLFLDSHQIGVFEGVMHHAGVHGTVQMHAYSTTSADFLCTWSP